MRRLFENGEHVGSRVSTECSRVARSELMEGGEDRGWADEDESPLLPRVENSTRNLRYPAAARQSTGCALSKAIAFPAA